MLTQTHCCYTLRNCNFERLSRKWPRYFQQPSQNELELSLKKHLAFGCECKKKSSSLNHKTVVHEKKKTSLEIVSPQCVHHNSVEKKITNSKHCTSDLLADRQA